MLFLWIIKSFWLHTLWFTYSQNGSLWPQWGLLYSYINFWRQSVNIIKDAQLLNFADDNTIASFSNSLEELITNHQKESKNAYTHVHIGFQEMKMLLGSFLLSNFNYCPLVWHFCSADLSQEIEKIQERALRLMILYNDSFSSYNSSTERPTMEVSRLRRLAIKVF